MNFAWPWCFLLLPAPWLLARFCAPLAQGFALRVPWMLPGSFRVNRRNRAGWLAGLAWGLLVLAAARPQQPLPLEQTFARGRDLMLAVDVSASMAIADLQSSGHAVPRLQVTRQLVRDFLARREGDRVGLIVFGRQAYLHTPMTEDIPAVGDALAGIETGLAGNETALGDAVALGVKYLRDLPARARAMILLTDGASNSGSLDPVRAAWLAAREGVRVHVLGIASATPGGLDEATLQQIAKQTGGSYARVTDSTGMALVLRQIEGAEPIAHADSATQRMQALYYWPLAGALLLGALLVLRAQRETAG